MAVTIDIGNPDDVHPTDKLTVGADGWRCRRCDGVRRVGRVLWAPVSTGHDGGSESSRVVDHGSGLPSEGGPLSGFEVAGIDGFSRLLKRRLWRHRGAQFPRRGETKGWHDMMVEQSRMSFVQWPGLPASPFQIGEIAWNQGESAFLACFRFSRTAVKRCDSHESCGNLTFE